MSSLVLLFALCSPHCEVTAAWIFPKHWYFPPDPTAIQNHPLGGYHIVRGPAIWFKIGKRSDHCEIIYHTYDNSKVVDVFLDLPFDFKVPHNVATLKRRATDE